MKGWKQERLTSGRLWGKWSSRLGKAVVRLLRWKLLLRWYQLKEERYLFSWLMMICENRPEEDIKEAIALYEFLHICHWKGHKSSSNKVTANHRSPWSWEDGCTIPAFHAITGADNTGSLPGKGKVTCWKAFLKADDSVLNADWPNSVERSNLVLTPKVELKDLSVNYTYQGIGFFEGFFLFRKKQAESDRLPPTQSALHQAIPRAHFQLMVWNKDRAKSCPAVTEWLWMGNGERRVGPRNDNSSTSSRGCHRACQVWVL